MTAVQPLPMADMLLIFDGTCGVCSRAADWLSTRNEPSRLLALPNQTPGLLKATGLTRGEVDRAVWLTDQQGNRFSGAAAVNRALAQCKRGPWALVSRLYAIRGVQQIEDIVYAWIAIHRGRLAILGAVPACERAGLDCGPV